jgi:hypothetical protein
LATDEEESAVTAKLQELGGAPKSYEVADEVVEEAVTAAEAEPDPEQ